MPVSLACPHCGVTCKIRDEHQGKMVRCPSCRTPFRAPPAQSPEQQPPAISPPPVPPPLPTQASPPSPEPPPPRTPRRRNRLALTALAAAAVVLLGIGVGAFLVWPAEEQQLAAEGQPKTEQKQPVEEKKPSPSNRHSVAEKKPPRQDPPSEKKDPPSQEAPDNEHPTPLIPQQSPRPADRVVNLPGPVANLCVGGSGRYLVLHLAGKKRLLLFDLVSGTVGKELSLPDEPVLFAANKDALVLVLTRSRQLKRYSLPAFQEQRSAALPVKGEVRVVGMGHASAGPLVLCGPVEQKEGVARWDFSFLDPHTLALKPLKGLNQWTRDITDPVHALQVSANGRAVSISLASGASYTLSLEKDRVVDGLIQARSGRLEYAIPDPSGTRVCTNQGSFLIGARHDEADYSRSDYRPTLPALEGTPYLVVHYLSRRVGVSAVEVHERGLDKPIAFLRDLQGLEMADPDEDGKVPPIDQRLFFLPSAKRIATLSPGRDRIYLRDFDLAKETEKLGDYIIASDLNRIRRYGPGETLTFSISAHSSKGPVTVGLKEGPPGLTVSRAGLVRWEVSNPVAARLLSVSLRLRAGSYSEERSLLLFPDTTGWQGPGRTTMWKKKTTAKPPTVVKGPPLVSPPTAAIPIATTPIKGDRATVELPAAAGELCLGGGGRFLFLHLPEKRQIAVFDVNQGKVVKEIPLAGEQVLFAAGMDSLIVLLLDRQVIQRWSLPAFERVRTAPLPTDQTILSVGMGAASSGPLMLGLANPNWPETQPKLLFLDPETFATIPILPNKDRFATFQSWSKLRVSANGRAIVAAAGGLSSFRLSGRRLEQLPLFLPGQPTYAIPGPDGWSVFSGFGLTRLSQKERFKAPDPRSMRQTLPAIDGQAYIAHPVPYAPPGTATTVHLLGSSGPITELASLDGLERPRRDGFRRGNEEQDWALDQRLVFLPAARLIVTIPLDRKKLILHRFDLEQAIAKTKSDYVRVTSVPKTLIQPGKHWSYPITAKTPRGDALYSLASGPKGMTVSDKGVVDWDAPADFPADDEVEVRVRVHKKDGPELVHSFWLQPARPAPAAPPAAAGQLQAEKPSPIPPPAIILPIKPTRLEGGSALVKLSSRCGEVCLGGGGRFLIFELPSERKLAVFDVNAGRVIHNVPLPEDPVLFAAGMHSLILVRYQTKRLHRISLTTFREEQTGPLPCPGQVTGAVMGHASNGPLILCGSNLQVSRTATRGVVFIDPTTLQLLPFNADEDRIRLGSGSRHALEMAVSASGKTAGFWVPRANASELRILRLVGDRVEFSREDVVVGWSLPGPDGQTIFTRDGLYTPRGVSLTRSNPITFPAVQGSFYLSLDPGDEGDRFAPVPRKPRKPSFRIQHPDEARPLGTLDPPPGFALDRENLQRPLYQQVFLIPEARVCVTLLDDRQRLHLQRFDLDAMLKKAEFDYLLPVAPRELRAVKGETLSLPVPVLSRKGKPRYRVEFGPKGLVVSAEGQLTWKVPANHPSGEEKVLLSIGNEAGFETFHTITLRLLPPKTVLRQPARPGLDKDPVHPPVVPQVVLKKGANKAEWVVGIRPPTFEGEEHAIELPGEVGAVCAGGSGRFLILDLPGTKELAVLDVNQSRIVKRIACREEPVSFAAGSEDLFVAYPKAGVLERWRLATFQREISVPIPWGRGTRGLLMGSASAGPLVAVTVRRQRIGVQPALTPVHPRTLRELPLPLQYKQIPLFGVARNPTISANGGVLTTGGTVLVRQGNVFVVHQRQTYWPLRPGPDGQVLYVYNTMTTPDGSPLVRPERRPPPGQTPRDPPLFLPALHGPLCFAVGDEVQLCLGGEDKTLVRFPRTEAIKASAAVTETRPNLLLIPAADLLVCLPPGQKRLVLHRCGLRSLFDRTKTAHLFVASQPRLHVRPGETYRYPVAVQSNQDRVTLRLLRGPEGMELSPGGELLWKVPADWKPETVVISLAVHDEAGQEASQTFNLDIQHDHANQE
jgi:hypothetical protein